MIIEITEWIGTYNLKISIMFQYTFFCFKEKILFPGLQINAYQMYHQGLSASLFVQTLVTHLIYINHLSRKGRYEKCIERKSLMQNMICLMYCQVLFSSQRKWINVFNKILVFQCKGGKPSNEKKNHKKFSCIFVRLPKIINSKKIVAERVKTKSSFQDVIKQQSTCANCRNKPVGVYVVTHGVTES